MSKAERDGIFERLEKARQMVDKAMSLYYRWLARLEAYDGHQAGQQPFLYGKGAKPRPTARLQVSDEGSATPVTIVNWQRKQGTLRS